MFLPPACWNEGAHCGEGAMFRISPTSGVAGPAPTRRDVTGPWDFSRRPDRYTDSLSAIGVRRGGSEVLISGAGRQAAPPEPQGL